MTPELQTISNLLCGSAACCKEKDSSGDGHVGDHVVSVNTLMEVLQFYI